MSKTATLYVRAQPGRTVPFHPSAYSVGGGAGGLLNPGECAEVNNTMEVRRAIRSGDLAEVPRPTKAETTTTSNTAARKSATKE